ncbi:MAG: hypothetical protein CL816_05020 [Coxiellaceae bacterium]|nr:hypothetical protein [Coxiellaceae bacterium]
MKILSTALLTMGLLHYSSVTAQQTITMKVKEICDWQNNCSEKSDVCEVAISYPPGGYTHIDSNGEISIPSDATEITGRAFGWTAVKKGMEIKQRCDDYDADEYGDDDDNDADEYGDDDDDNDCEDTDDCTTVEVRVLI